MEGLPLPSLGKLSIVGIGPGSLEDMTLRAVKAISESEHVIGVGTYIDQIAPLLQDQKVSRGSMGEEVCRAERAIELAAQGYAVALISGGDPNVYGMASLVLDMLATRREAIDFEVIPGVTAANAVAALLGAPLSGDYAIISLSDLLTPWSAIEKRIQRAAESDFVIVLYNPRSKKRTRNLSKCIELLLNYRQAVPVGIVTNGRRRDEKVVITTLDVLPQFESIIDMHTTIIVGNKDSFIWEDKIITRRGYHNKYDY
ncbi:MAG: precorrin-3B C(17)-methyltransferase [Halobacteriota archaeon]